ncbi:Transposon Ty3-I Gag-Pol polyprotein [Araneus ventricosus]|uniref:RNA-directed DNA polymerase n=1 Tax=Araneus ventricosus TaxID=182803 RepID=A0A4Y2W8L0_ARAVE|nr:Transposon Ty3-I Gag-Pol polyprotein [Araneus ventricosus]
MAALHINPPENFTFSTPCNWSKWKMRFERYRIASGLSTKTGNEQVNSLLYIMGEQAEDIFSSFGLSETEQDDFDIVLKKFNDHFVVKKNTIFERAQFNKRVQLDGESVNTFITALYTLAEHCEYGVLHDELIRDRIVVGIRDKNLSEKLQLDADLTLTKVIERVRLSEAVKEQQEKMIEKDNASVNAISPNKPAKFLKQKPSSGARKQNVKSDFHRQNNENESRLHGKCKWCGKQRHDKRVCPARDARCRQCSKIGHYAKISAADPKAKFPELFKGLGVMKGCYSIKLKPGAIPFAITCPRRVPIPLLKQTKAELERMVEEKVITPVLKPTEWCAPVVIVPKSDGNVRICVDLIELNKNVMRELHPLPKAEYSLNLLTGAKMFSKLDANSGFWQIPLDKKSSYLTTFITPFGRFRFQRLPFGISSAPEHFQRRMSQMLEGIPGTICHMDDILIWGSTQEEHDQRLTEVCHIIDGQGIHPDPDKIAAIENYQPPTNKKELKQLLGMANYLARFVPNYSDILFPLTSMLSNKLTFVWKAPQEAAFQKLKKILSSDPVLMIFDPRKETTVTTDASSYGLGATICQKQADGRRSVIAYASRTLTPTESRYAQIEKEALAVVWGCEKFRDYLTGMHFKIETDHKPLIPIFSKKNLDDLSPRLQRIKLRMMKFSYTIVHIPGKELFAADALSRNPQKVPYKREELEAEIDAFIQMITSSLPASSRRLDELRVAQLKDETCQKLTDYVLKGWPSKKEVDTLCAPYWQNRYEISVQDGLLMRGCRIIIPKSHQAEVLNQIHEGHLGITKCRARARCSVYWPGISKVIEEKIKSCTACIQESSNRHQPLIPTSFPERPWEVLGLDLFKYKNSWYLLISDYYSRYPEIARLDRLTSAEIINHCKSIFSRHGIPDVVRSDNGPQFDPVKTVEFKDFSQSYGFTHISSSPKFSQSNGLIEAAVKTVKARIKKSRDPYLALMAYRATPLENGFSPSELLMGRRINTTLPVAKTQLQPYSVNKKVLEAKEERRIEARKRTT